VERASTLEDIRAEVLTPDRLNAVVFGGFAAVALLISVVGVAGVLAFSVSGRTREFGIRMALGAQPRNILTGVLLEGTVIAGIGVGAGVVVGFAFARAIGKYVAEVHQPGALAFVASPHRHSGGAAVIASAVPAARAARVNAWKRCARSNCQSFHPHNLAASLGDSPRSTTQNRESRRGETHPDKWLPGESQ
jgi:putative ABC transport system permease protein